MLRQISSLILLVGILLPAAALPLTDEVVEERDSNPNVARYPVTDQRWVDSATGALVAAFDLAGGPYSGTAEVQARTYLAESAGEYGLLNATDDLELTYVKQTPVGDHVRFHQTVAGVPVFESDVVVSIGGGTGHVIAVSSRYRVAAAALATAPAISPETARTAAIARIGATEERIGPETPPSLGLLPTEDGAFPLAYRVVIPAANPLGDWEVMVDASNGQILRVRDQAVNIDGSGLAFDPDPLTTAEVPYGTPGYVDGNDANTPQLEAETFLRTLHDIEFSSGLYRLKGPYCRIEEFESPLVLPVTAATPDGFQFTRNASGFEDVEVYWGIDMNQRYIQDLGFFNIQNNSIWCDTHGLNGQDNSHYIPSTNRLAWGEGGVDDAEDLDVVLHEYGHAIQHGSVPGWGGGDEGSMGEGFGDYWTGSYSASVSLYRWEWVFNWDGHNPFWPGRILNHTGHYPQNWVGGIHNKGQLWSSTLMQIWFEVTREVIDQIVLGHHFLLGTSALVTQAAAALVTTDLSLNEGLNVDTIEHFCELRGFFTAGQYEIPSITHTPLGDTSLPGPYTVTAVCTSASGINSVEVRYGIGGQITGSAPMIPTGNPDEYSGEIPGLGGFGTAIYYIVAENNASPTRYKATDPRSAPSGEVHSFQITSSTGVAGLEAAPGRFVLAGATPNPFNPSTRITYSLGTRVPVRLAVYSPTGQLVRVLVDGVQEAVVHEIDWDGRDDSGRELASGIYLARLDAGLFSAQQKMVLLK